MYIMMSGCPPFNGEEDRDIQAAAKTGKFEYPSPAWDHVSPEGKEMINKMLMLDHHNRPSAEEILDFKWLKSKEVVTGKVTPDLGNRLKQFKGYSRMKKVALTLIARQLKDEELAELKETFIALDTNKDGMLSHQELSDGMAKHKVDLPADMEEVLKNLDTDGSGKVDYTEFIAATLNVSQYMRKEILWAAFRSFDTDGDGFISTKEFQDLLQENEQLAKEIIKEVDANSDGKISFEEFEKMLAN